MYRYFSEFLSYWKKSKNRKPLIVRGARQVGKTYTIEKFGSNDFDVFLKINFEENPELKDIFKTNNVDEIIQTLELFSGKNLRGKNTLLFLDEIQSCPEAITTLRYFYENMPGLYLITAGSLLDHLLNNLSYSMPVGRVEFAYMYPMNFLEFLLAMNEKLLHDYLLSYSFNEKINDAIHEKLLKYVRHYYFVGGMPEAVKVYYDTKSLQETSRVHESILRSLEFDFAKYGTRKQQELLTKTLRYIPKALGRKLKYVNIDSSARSDTIKDVLQLLVNSRIVHLIKSTVSAGVPLEYGVNEKSFKPLFLDIGLANSLLKLNLSDIEKLTVENEGGLAEQFVGQQILTFGPEYIDKQLYYWSRNKKNSEAEIDYLIEIDRSILPVEVKAGKAGTLKSLHIYMAEKKKNIALRVNADKPSIAQIKTSVLSEKKQLKAEYTLYSIPFYLLNETVVGKTVKISTE